MADLFGKLKFKITSEPYAGRYEIDFGDFTAGELGDAHTAVGRSLETLLMETGRDGAPPPLSLLAAFVWLTRRRSAKGLAYRAVADEIRWANVDFDLDDEPAEASASPET